jgi:hypothetical protein
MSRYIWSTSLMMGLFFAATAQADDLTQGDPQCTMVTFVAPVLPVTQTIFTKETLNHYLPPQALTPTTDSSRVASQVEASVEQKIAEDISKSEMFRKSSLGKTTTQLETLSQKSVAVSNKSKLEFKVKVVERQAVIIYQAAIKSEVIYTISQGTIKWVLSRPLGRTTTIAFTNTIGQDGSNPSSILSLNHTF